MSWGSDNPLWAAVFFAHERGSVYGLLGLGDSWEFPGGCGWEVWSTIHQTQSIKGSKDIGL